MKSLTDEKTDHATVTKKRGRPKKETETRQELQFKHRSAVRTYLVDVVIVNSGGTVEVESVSISSQNRASDLTRAVRSLGANKLKNLIRRQLIKSKVISPLEHLSFGAQALLK